MGRRPIFLEKINRGDIPREVLERIYYLIGKGGITPSSSLRSLGFAQSVNLFNVAVWASLFFCPETVSASAGKREAARNRR